jgi:hypothetical protein
MVPWHAPLDLDIIVDEIALKYIRDEFDRAVGENARFGEGLRVELQRHERGFVVMRDDIRLAVIHANRVQIPGRDAIHANFLVPGPQWRQVADALRDAEPELVAEWTRKQAKVAAEATAAEATTGRRHATARQHFDYLPSYFTMPGEEGEERDIPWARHRGVVDRNAGEPCRKYEEFRTTYDLPESELTRRMWRAYKPPSARKRRGVGKQPEPTPYERAFPSDRTSERLREVNPPEAQPESWR